MISIIRPRRENRVELLKSAFHASSEPSYFTFRCMEIKKIKVPRKAIGRRRLPVGKSGKMVTDSLFSHESWLRRELRVSKDAAAFSLLSLRSSFGGERVASGRPIDPHRVTVRSCRGACKRKRLSHRINSSGHPFQLPFPHLFGPNAQLICILLASLCISSSQTQ